MPSRPIFLSRAARRNYYLAQAAGLILVTTVLAALVALVLLGATSLFSH